MHKLILASQSPRRREILTREGFEFTALPSQVSENPDESLNIPERILDIARRKAWHIFNSLEVKNRSTVGQALIVLAADTEVVIENRTLGKPEDADAAFAMLRLLSGKTHEVITAVVLIENISGAETSHLETTKVIFKELTDQQIQNYIQTGAPFDKAGGYGIQDDSKYFVERFDGDYDNIVGLPITAIKKIFMEKNWRIIK